MKKRNMLYGLRPFWIYFFVVFGLGLAFMIAQSLLLFALLLPSIVIALVLAYVVGKAVQKRRGTSRRMERVIIAFVCSALIMATIPLSHFISTFVEGYSFPFDLSKYNNKAFFIIWGLHSIIFWLGQEMKADI